MNRRRYKKSNYRKRIIKTIVIISVVSFIVLFAVFMIVGLSLAEKTTDYTPFEDEFDYNESDSETARKPKNVKAYPLPLLEDNSIFSSRLAKIKEDAIALLENVASSEELEALRVKFLGKKGELTAILKQMGSLSPEERPIMGQLVNKAKAEVEELIAGIA